MTNNKPVDRRRAGVTQKALRILLCATAFDRFFSASTPGAFHGIHQVSTSTSLRSRTTLISFPELGLAKSDRGFLYSSKSLQSVTQPM